jgi:hypothetical protein
MKSSDLHVVGVFSNLRNWRTRVRLLRRWVSHMRDCGVSLTLVEHAVGERDFVFSHDSDEMKDVNYYQITGDARHENWLKEGLVKYGVSRLPAGAKYLAVIDSDVFFQRADWAVATIDLLQIHRVVQPWSYCLDLGPDQNPIPDESGQLLNRSFCAAWVAGDVKVTANDYGVGRPTGSWMRNQEAGKDTRQHYGYAWAFRLETWNDFGGFPDWIPTGAADYFSALAFAGKLSVSEKAYDSPAYLRRLRVFANLCDQHVKQDLGVLPGLLSHGFHGTKKNRIYLDRGGLLTEANFDPDVDIGYDRHGLPFLVSDNRLLRDGLRRLSVIRNEDSEYVG